jgi:hypothetical protein
MHALNDSIPINLSSAVAMAVVTLLAVLRIHVGAVRSRHDRWVPHTITAEIILEEQHT